MMSVQRQNWCSYEIEGGEELLFSIWVKGYPSCAEKKDMENKVKRLSVVGAKMNLPTCVLQKHVPTKVGADLFVYL